MTELKDGESMKDYKKRFKEQSTQNKKEENMKTKLNTLKTVAKYVATVAVTLAVVAAFYYTYNEGVEAGKQQQKVITEQINTEVASQLKPDQK